MASTSTPPAPSNQAFLLFPELPAELRLRIWGLTLPTARIVSIRCRSRSPSISSSPSSSLSSSSLTPPLPPPPPQATPPALAAPPSYTITQQRHHHRPRPSLRGCTSSARIPVCLHVCQESRTEALRTYQPMFGIGRQRGQIFFNPAIDVLYFGPRDGYMASEAQLRTVLTLVEPRELMLVRNLAINDALFWPDVRASCYHSASAASLTLEVLAQVRARFPYLDHLIIVPRDDNPLYSADATLVRCPVPQERLAKQVQVALACLSEGTEPRWETPAWGIMSIAAEPV